MANKRTNLHHVNPAAALCSTLTTTQRSGGLWSHRSVMTGNGTGCPSSPDGTSDPLAHAHVWSVSTASWPEHKISLDSLENLFHRCVLEDPKAGAVAYLAMLEFEGGALEALLDPHEAHLDRILILDWVEVATRWQGRAIGRRVAAQCLASAGAFYRETLVLASPDRSDDLDSELAEMPSRILLTALGLTPLPTGLWAGRYSVNRLLVRNVHHASS